MNICCIHGTYSGLNHDHSVFTYICMYFWRQPFKFKVEHFQFFGYNEKKVCASQGVWGVSPLPICSLWMRSCNKEIVHRWIQGGGAAVPPYRTFLNYTGVRDLTIPCLSPPPQGKILYTPLKSHTKGLCILHVSLKQDFRLGQVFPFEIRFISNLYMEYGFWCLW